MILAAGRGERMRPLTDTLPKPLLKVDGKALIEYHIQALKEAGIKDILINTAWLGDIIPEYLGDGAYWGVKLTYSHEESALETAGGIRKALDFFADEPFVVVNGDIWTDFDFSLLNKPKAKAHLVLVPNPEQHPKGDFGLDNGTVLAQSDTQYTFSGIGVYQPEIFADLELNQAEPLAPILRNLMEKQSVTGQLYQGEWRDIGTPERLEALNKEFQKPIKTINFDMGGDMNLDIKPEDKD
ncbi:MAG: nucleotidyltransferase family protein [Gammaproteobacteria bacterium]|nr:nucleotidyltransferase family protein [Gammaproteobacteria bacterium]